MLFLGYDYAPSFFGKGKVKPMHIVMKNEKFTNVFSKLSEGEIPYEIVSTTVEYVCLTYGFKCNRSPSSLSSLFQ